MVNPIILAELAKARHQDLLKEAESWRLVSQEIEKEFDKMGMIRRILTDVKRRIKFPQNRDSSFPLFSDENVRRPHI